MIDRTAERTEAPTPRRREEMRREGVVARSRDLTAALALLAVAAVAMVAGPTTVLRMAHGLRGLLEGPANPTRPAGLAGLAREAGGLALWGAGGVVLTVGAVTLLATLGQVGVLLTSRPLEPDLERVSPAAGLRRLLDARAGMRVVMACLKVVVLGGVAAWSIRADADRLLALTFLEPLPMLRAAWPVAGGLALRLAAALLALGLLDYAFQWHCREQAIRMTLYEKRQEARATDGDPAVRRRRARIARRHAGVESAGRPPDRPPDRPPHRDDPPPSRASRRSTP